MGSTSIVDLKIGAELRSAPRPMTRERMRRYVDAQPTVAIDDGRIHTQPPTIHDDDAYAKKQGLPGIIADGMVSTNWIQGLLFDVFGRALARKGRLRTKYIAPIYEDQIVICVAKVTAKARTETGETAYQFDVWCEDDTGKKLTVGEALVYAPAA
ncbi:MAG: MaoC family dehydratase [Proteobacteria bacterium]|nr:MaoC family dehydratase [Pseudomonadota bacterium]